jgi:hypothetical protein
MIEMNRAYHEGMPDMDEPVNVDMDPEEALRLLLREEHVEEPQDAPTDEDSNEEDTD